MVWTYIFHLVLFPVHLINKIITLSERVHNSLEKTVAKKSGERKIR